jgi:alpha-ribazole phosphatase
MFIYLIRHTKPAIEKGICYGQTDLNLVDSFEEEAAVIKNVLPPSISHVYSSPLTRCKRLAEYLFNSEISFHDDLKELHCGSWEMQVWDKIPAVELQPWMDDFVQVRVPGGESYMDLFARTVNRYKEIISAPLPAAIIAHGGVIRSILSHVTGTPLEDSFKVFPLYYGAVVQINSISNEVKILSNIEVQGEQHRPSEWVSKQA